MHEPQSCLKSRTPIPSSEDIHPSPEFQEEAALIRFYQSVVTSQHPPAKLKMCPYPIDDTRALMLDFLKLADQTQNDPMKATDSVTTRPQAPAE